MGWYRWGVHWVSERGHWGGPNKCEVHVKNNRKYNFFAVGGQQETGQRNERTREWRAAGRKCVCEGGGGEEGGRGRDVRRTGAKGVKADRG